MIRYTLAGDPIPMVVGKQQLDVVFQRIKSKRASKKRDAKRQLIRELREDLMREARA